MPQHKTFVHARQVVPVIVATFLLIALVAPFLTFRSIWTDEMATLGNALGLIHGLRNDANQALYYVIMFAVVRITPPTPVGLRLPSLIFAMLCIPLMFLVGRRLLGSSIGNNAAILLATHVFLIGYAQEARGYTLYLLMVLMATLVFFHALRTGKFWWWAYAFTGVLLVYSHYFGILLIATHGTVLLLKPALLKRNVRLMVLPALFALVMLSPAWLFQPVSAEQVSWIPPLDGVALRGLASALVSGGNISLFIMYSGLTLYGSVRLFQYRGSLDSWVPLLIGLSFLLPLSISLIVSALWVDIFVSRYLILLLPFLLLIVTYGIHHIPGPALRYTIGALLLLLHFYGLLQFYRLVPYGRTFMSPVQVEEWREAAEYMQTHIQPGDAVVFNGGYNFPPLLYNSRGLNTPWDELHYAGFYEASEDLPADPFAPLSGTVLVDTLPGDIVEHTAGTQRVWIVLAHGGPSIDAYHEALGADYMLVDARQFNWEPALYLLEHR